MKTHFRITIYLMLAISLNPQIGKSQIRPIVIDSIMTGGNTFKYLVKTDSTWKLCYKGFINNGPFTGTYDLYYPCYVITNQHYIKQTFDVTNGKIIHQSKIKRFPTNASASDTIENKKDTENIGDKKSNPRPIVGDSIMTIGSNQLYLVRVDSLWWLCQGGRVQTASYSKPYTGSYSLFYPCFIINGRRYFKQSFVFYNGKMISKSDIQPFPSNVNPLDTTIEQDVYSNGEYSKPETQAYKDSMKRIEDNAILEADMDILSSHGELTQFTDMEFNFVSLRIQKFMNDVMEYTSYDEGSSDFSKPIKTITQRYFPKISFNNSKSFIQFKYIVIPNGNVLTIKSCEISGNLNYLVDFYVSYWSTKIYIEGRTEGEIVHNHLLNDDISFQFFPASGNGKIVITKNK